MYPQTLSSPTGQEEFVYKLQISNVRNPGTGLDRLDTAGRRAFRRMDTSSTCRRLGPFVSRVVASSDVPLLPRP